MTDRIKLAAIMTCFAVMTCWAGQDTQPVDTSHFEGWEEWPLYRPGDLKLDSSRLTPSRIRFQGMFQNPQGPSQTTMYMDLWNVFFQGRRALLIQWTSTGSAQGPNNTAAMDILAVDRTTFSVLFKIAATQGDRNWGGPYDFIHLKPDGVVNLHLPETGQAKTQTLETQSTFFDYASYQFLFPLLDLKPGMKFRLHDYQRRNNLEQAIPVRVLGRTAVADAQGKDQEVWRVDVMSPSGAGLTEFYVSEQAPFFYGWRVRLTKDGRVLSSLKFVDHRKIEL